MNIIIIHGAYGNPEENWFPWLKLELEKLGHNVFIPKFPTPENQNLESWLDVFKDYEQYLDEDSILIGHSLGPAFILNILEKKDKPIKAAFFVAGFVGKLGNSEFDEINKSFVDKEFNWDKIKENCKSFFIFYSDNDPYVPQEKAKELASHLNIESTLIKSAGHFNEAAGYTKFPALLEKIKEFLR